MQSPTIGAMDLIPPMVFARGRYSNFAVTVTANFDASVGRYRAKTIEICADEDAELTGTQLRSIRVDELVRQAAHDALPTNRDDAAPGGPLGSVARIYVGAVARGDAPVQAVADELGISKSAASRLATRARDRGLLTVVDKRGRLREI